MNLFVQHNKAKIVATIVTAILAFTLYVGYQLFIPRDSSYSGQPLEVEVVFGQGSSQIAGTLLSNEIIRNEFFFVMYVKLSGADKILRAGKYLMSPAMSVVEIVRRLSGGLSQSDDISITVPEGSNVWDIDDILFTAGLLVARGDFARTQQKNEGYLFPDTYRFSAQLKSESEKGKNPEIISNVMRDNFFKKAGNNLGRDVIITASMLEKEGKTSKDFELIAGIIQKRLKLNMLLQIDATVGYGWCLKILALRRYSEGCDVAQAPIGTEITQDGPYNSYINKGLPAGPISNPGLRAIKAVQNPVESDFLFYLSSRDGSQLIYAKTAAEHLRNRQKYLGL